MDRPKRATTRVTDFRRCHLSGDLPGQQTAVLDTAMATPEELATQLEEERENSKKMQEDIEMQCIQQELDAKRMKQEQLQAARDKLKQAKEHAALEHSKCMAKMEERTTSSMEKTSSSTLDWFKQQMEALLKPGTPQADTEENRRKQQQLEKEAAIAGLKRQQEEISSRLKELEGTEPLADPKSDNTSNQELLLQQLKAALATKKEEDPNKAVLRALITQQNKTTVEGGVSTLNLNKQEEGESELSRYILTGEEEGTTRPRKVKSGILDRATTNIQQKQVWPQQNLGEDWADEDIEFKQMRFEHLVAGETRTIEMSTEPAEILGRLRLLRRMAYLKFRGYSGTSSERCMQPYSHQLKPGNTPGSPTLTDLKPSYTEK